MNRCLTQYGPEVIDLLMHELQRGNWQVDGDALFEVYFRYDLFKQDEGEVYFSKMKEIWNLFKYGPLWKKNIIDSGDQKVEQVEKILTK